MRRELTTKEKWAPVDRILNDINSRKKRGESACRNYFEDYINKNFNRG